ncbi:hypothetical protein M0802_001089 [Mischocyttarus mexicanus]|nr:hypothetical protein M0802_001089 [Mischocyttarus mexicanus]
MGSERVLRVQLIRSTSMDSKVNVDRKTGEIKAGQGAKLCLLFEYVDKSERQKEKEKEILKEKDNEMDLGMLP